MGKKIVPKTLAGVLGVLGFGACGSSNVGTAVCMYGCPYSDFTAKGTVTDSEGKPLEGIKMTLAAKNYEQSPIDSAFTDASGKAEIAVRDMITEKDTLSVTFEDVDGAANGGEFLTKTVEGSPKFTAKGDGSWDMGDFELEVKVKLEK